MLVESDFMPARAFQNPHLQTIISSLFRITPRVTLKRERLELDDGDFLDLDWGKHFPERPVVLVLHGLEGNSQSNYAAGILKALEQQQFNTVLLHSRGCSGEPNRLVRGYTAGTTDDMATVASLIQQRFPSVPITAVGYSLGANAVLKWLGETGDNNPLTTAVAVSAPFDLAACATRLDSGASKIYQRFLLKKMKAAARAKQEILQAAIAFPDLKNIHTFTQFDHQITAPTHGYDSAQSYYTDASCKQYLLGVRKPTLIIQALDDPFMYAHSMPIERELSESVRLEWSKQGGHVGFIHQNAETRFWLEHRIPNWFEDQLTNKQ